MVALGALWSGGATPLLSFASPVSTPLLLLPLLLLLLLFPTLILLLQILDCSSMNTVTPGRKQEFDGTNHSCSQGNGR